MTKDAKIYRGYVIHCLIHKYKMDEVEATMAVKDSYLNESLEKYPEETMHDDIETYANDIYNYYIKL